MNWSRTENFKVRGYEVGPDQRVPLQNLCGYMEEAAALHAAELGLSVEKLARHGLAWVLARTRMAFEELPCLAGYDLADEAASQVQVKTWPVAVNKLQFRRDFLMAWRGRVFARAVTDWVVINLESRRVERVPEFIGKMQPENPERVMPAEKFKLAGQEGAPTLASFVVRRADIDRNNHVNNARFTEWLIESVPEGFAGAGQLKGIQIIYRAEGLYGDTVLARGTEDPEEPSAFLHGLCRASDNQELVRARTFWG
jgi:acyl-ACP thioesterase